MPSTFTCQNDDMKGEYNQFIFWKWIKMVIFFNVHFSTAWLVMQLDMMQLDRKRKRVGSPSQMAKHNPRGYMGQGRFRGRNTALQWCTPPPLATLCVGVQTLGTGPTHSSSTSKPGRSWVQERRWESNCQLGLRHQWKSYEAPSRLDAKRLQMQDWLHITTLQVPKRE